MIINCPHCYGTGEEPDAYDLTNKSDPKCHRCKGTGTINTQKKNDK